MDEKMAKVFDEIEKAMEMAYKAANKIVDEYEKDNLPPDPVYNLAVGTITSINRYRREKKEGVDRGL
jgi:predicted RNA polymerase sigma factor